MKTESYKDFIPNDIIGRILKNVTGNHGDFKPHRDFYKKLNIRQKRFGQLVRGEVTPTTEELTAVCAYFKKSLGVDIPLVQLTIFDNNEEILNVKV